MTPPLTDLRSVIEALEILSVACYPITYAQTRKLASNALAAARRLEQQTQEPVGTVMDGTVAVNYETVIFHKVLPAGTKLYASPLAADGFALVPMEPTEAMQEAGLVEGFNAEGSDLKRRELYKIVRKMYRAMLAAANGEKNGL